ncbi:MAG: DMT family transporter [Thaumarchaeota archaeon]|nr:DMT family transporter [Nitrososphaerota archaeon]
MKTKLLDVILIIFVCLVWAGNYFVIKGVLPYVDPITFALLRAVLGGAFVFAIGGYALKGITRRDLVWLLALGLFNVALFLVFLNASLLTANTGVSSTLVYTQPVIVAALSPLLGEKLTRNRIAGIAAAFCGIVVVFLPSIIAASFVVGDVYALAASASWAVAILLFKRWNPSMNTNAVTAVQSVFGGVFILPVLAFERPFLDPTVAFWVFLGYNVILASGVAYVVYWKILSRMPAAQFTSYFFLVPVLATIMASIFQLSVPPANELVGTVLVAVGIVVVNR